MVHCKIIVCVCLMEGVGEHLVLLNCFDRQNFCKFIGTRLLFEHASIWFYGQTNLLLIGNVGDTAKLTTLQHYVTGIQKQKNARIFRIDKYIKNHKNTRIGQRLNKVTYFKWHYHRFSKNKIFLLFLILQCLYCSRWSVILN